ncbi:Cell cycle serine/threonine-protein kinase cdc5/MSD2 [Tulasnella sp. JGI-2019a]|nr:Cell cycle serine/threonine-protein kinase cdc5/MSD2 [Tulasnella sp. JGI-2019a]
MSAAYGPRAPQAAHFRRTATHDVPLASNYANVKRDPQPQQQQQQKPVQSAPPPPPAKDGDEIGPLNRQNSKAVPPSPPRVIRDLHKTVAFTKIGFLGEGGFARVYEVADLKGTRHAIKVVTKSSLNSRKSKTKLYAEIKLHRALEHPNIVGFEECFEDEQNVYMTLELCPNGSMMDMLRRRRRFTEPEARLYMVQIIGACHYMHSNQVIHRDLKLGNLFLDRDMNIKVGDFGLAALIETPGERKKTICGTPNYIAPEVLFDTANGHSFEVDTWSMGVILYTLVVGKPPFQTREVKEIYQRIRDNMYEFPTTADRPLSEEVMHLIEQILTHDPEQRPKLYDILDHPFFTEGLVPSTIPVVALERTPVFPGISRAKSRTNLLRLRRQCWLDDDVSTLSHSVASMAIQSNQSSAGVAAQQEREFHKAVQPASPISALLNSARQPLVTVSDPTGAGRSGGLMKKLVAAAAQEKAKVAGSPLKQQIGSEAGGGLRPALKKGLATVEEQDEEEQAHQQQQAKDEKNRTRELESQKARIVAQMAPARAAAGKHPADGEDDRENVPPVAEFERDPIRSEKGKDADREGRRRERVASMPSLPAAPTAGGGRAPAPVDRAVAPPPSASSVQQQVPVIRKPSKPDSGTEAEPSAVGPSSSFLPVSNVKLHGFEQVAETLADAFDQKDKGRLFRNPADDANIVPAKVFIVSWVDYCNKYGMGYALTDGTIGVYFNDSTTLLMSPDKQNLEYISARRSASVFVRKHYGTEKGQHPEELNNKLYLLKHFEDYMLERLYGQHDYCYDDLERGSGLDFVQKYFRMKNVIVFKLSHEVIQFNFYDHSKIILSNSGLAVTYLDKHYRASSFSLSSLVERVMKPDPTDEETTKRERKLLDKIRYCKEVLISIRTVSSSTSVKTGLGISGVGKDS